MLAAAATTNMAWIIGVIFTLGWVAYYFFNRHAGKAEIGSEIELAPNRRPYYDDEELEGPRLLRVQFLAVILLATMVVGLPLYWILEPGRQEAKTRSWDKQFATWGSRLFATTADGGFNCAGCHGGMNATGGVADFVVTDPLSQNVEAVSWRAPALNTVLYRFDASEVEFIITYGRPGTPMSAWGTAGGGAMNEQQIETLVEYIKSITVEPEGCAVQGAEGIDTDAAPSTVCEGGHLPTETQEAIQAAAEQAVADGTYASLGEALFNLDLDSGAYSCARCHTPGWSYGDPGQAGLGVLGWNITNGATVDHFPQKQDMVDFIKNGSVNGARYGIQGQGSGKMPGFGALLTDEQINAIVDYVRTL
jgi:mono/diheme cytochrome c family protein